MKTKTMKQTLLLILTFFLFTGTVYSQKRVTVDATGEVMMDADQITLNVQMISSGESAEEVFERHKEQERMFADLIREHGLEESLIFQPMRIGIHHTRDKKEYRSHQTAQVTLEDFELFEQLQVILIENGFDQFSGNFSSSDLEEGERLALKTAIATAREKADLIAAELGQRVGDVHTVEHAVYRVMPYQEGIQMARSMDSSGALTQFEQTVPVSATIRITYVLAPAVH